MCTARSATGQGLLLSFRPYVVLFVFFVACAVLSGNSFAADDWNVDGENGYLHLSGTLSEGACTLDMTSAHQDVSLGAISKQTLNHPGARGMPVFFTVKLRRCSRTGGDETDFYTGASTEDAVRPVVTLNFTGVADPARPELFSAAGVDGLGLLLSDGEGRTVRPGMPGEPQILQTGDNILTYSVTPVRTPEPLSEGEFRVVASFEVSYD